MGRNAAAHEVPSKNDYPAPAGAYYFMHHKDERVGIIHGCPCGCGAWSALWFENYEYNDVPRWKVTGEWPKVTLSPSIGIGRGQGTNADRTGPTSAGFHWHGFLEDGVFVEK